MPAMNLRPLALLALVGAVSADHYDVYILAGQSNAGGHGYVSREFSQFSPQGDDGLEELGKSSYLEPQPDTLFIHWRGGTPNAGRPVLWEARSDGWIPMRAGYSLYGYNSSSPELLGTETVNHPFGAEVTFTERIREGRPGRKVAVIKYSQGNTSLGTAAAPGAWDPAAGRAYDIATLANAGHCYRGLLDLVEQSLAALSQQGHTHELRGMLWHQGESDSGLSTTVYKDRLKEFIAAIRSDLGKPELPFLIGELIQSGYANTRNAQRLAAAETANASFISSVALAGDSTTIHFDTTAQLDFGRRYAERMLQSGPAMRREIARWKLDETTLPWTGSYAPIPDAASGGEGVLFGYAEADQALVDGSVVNREGPGGGGDRAYDFAPDSGISGVNTRRPDALPATGDFTLLVWMKTTDPHVAQGHLFSNNNGQPGRANLHLQSGALTWFHNGGVTLSEPGSPVFDGEWHRVGVMRKGSDWSLLRDGTVVATGNSGGAIGQETEWMIGRMRAFNGNFEGMIGDVTVLNHAIADPLEIESSQFLPGGTCQLAWTSQPGFEYGIEWSPDLADWNLLRIVPAAPGTITLDSFPDPGDGRRLFLRIR
jgi:iduronate 2-sulfatase